MLSSVLKNAGHNTYLIYLKEHENRIKTKKDAKNTVIMHEGVNSFGADMIFSYGEPITEIEADILLGLLEEINPQLISFSLRSISIDLVKGITEKIRQKFKAPVIWGGVGPTLEPQRCLQYADIVCLGEGEYPLLELAEMLSRKLLALQRSLLKKQH